MATGAVRWSYCSADKAWRTLLGATDTAVYLKSRTEDGKSVLTAIDATKGEELWRYPVGLPGGGETIAQGPIAGSGVVVVTVNEGSGAELVAVDAMTGTERWRTTLPIDNVQMTPAGPTPGTVTGTGPFTTVESVFAPFANTDTVVVLAGNVGGLRGFDRTTGTQLWTSPLALQDDSGVRVERSAAAVAGAIVILPAHGNLVAIDARTGTELWQAPGLHHPSAGAGFVVGYQGNGPAQTVSAIDAHTGTLLWTQPGAPSYGDLWAIGGGVVAVLDDTHQIVAYELATGQVRWRRTAQDSTRSEPQIAVDDAVFILWEANVGVLSPTDGSTRWEAQAPLGSPLMSSVANNTDTLFVSVNTLAW
jgi:outer membrane protein assembly factor BamB